MPEPVKVSRRYDSTRRRVQAAQTRRDILNAARELFLERGFTATTLANVAAAAGVAVETIYRAFDGKAGLFRAVVEDVVFAGDGVEQGEPPGSPLRRQFDAIVAEHDPRRQFELYADLQPELQARIGPLMRILAEASTADPAMRQTAEQLDAQRLAGMERFAKLLADRRVLRAGLTVDEARDVLWAATSHSMYELLVNHRGWTPNRYRDWLADSLARLLLHQDPG
jgi:AcrR family transcriptional regulator